MRSGTVSNTMLTSLIPIPSGWSLVTSDTSLISKQTAKNIIDNYLVKYLDRTPADIGGTYNKVEFLAKLKDSVQGSSRTLDSSTATGKISGYKQKDYSIFSLEISVSFPTSLSAYCDDFEVILDRIKIPDLPGWSIVR